MLGVVKRVAVHWVVVSGDFGTDLVIYITLVCIGMMICNGWVVSNYKAYVSYHGLEKYVSVCNVTKDLYYWGILMIGLEKGLERKKIMFCIMILKGNNICFI